MNLAGPMPTNTNQNPLDLNEKVFLKNKCTIPRFESVVVRARTHCMMMMGYCLNIMTQAPYIEDWANLPVGVYVILTYSELRDGSWSVTVVLHNLTGKPVHLQAGWVITQVLAANVIPEGKPTPELMKKLDEQDPESISPKLSIEERQELLMQLLRQEGGLDELAQWTPELARKFEQMLMEYHDIFSLNKNEIGCTDAAKHIIELLDDEPFKEKFWQITFWMKSGSTFRKCWTVQPSALHSPLGTMPWSLSGRKMEGFGSVSTSGHLTLGLKRILTPFCICKRQ